MDFDALISLYPAREQVFLLPSALGIILHPSIKNANTIDEFKMKLIKPFKGNTYYYPYRAFGGQNKIVYPTRFVRRAIFF